MKILVINGSPKAEKSGTLKLAREFVTGIGEQATFVNAVELNIKPCLGCYACWHNTPGKCVLHDDMADMLDDITSSELVIWAMPLYYYGMPTIAKAIVDRMLPRTCPQQYVDDAGRTYHPSRAESTARFMLISGCGFPNIAHNYESLLLQFGLIFGEGFPRILCVEAPLLSIPAAEPVARPYLDAVRKAGAEFAQAGCISAATQAVLDSPMYPPEQYRNDVNNG